MKIDFRAGPARAGVVVLLGNGHRDSANTHDIVKTQADRLRAITGVYLPIEPIEPRY